MPSRIRRIIGVGKADDESSEAGPWNPTAHANDLIECCMQELVIHRLTEGFLRWDEKVDPRSRIALSYR